MKKNVLATIVGMDCNNRRDKMPRFTHATTILLAAIATLLSCSQAQATMITSVSASSGFTYQIVPNGLNNNVLAYIDRTFEWNDVPAFLVGADYIKTREDDDFNASLQVDVTLSSPGSLYLFFDNQFGPAAWVASNGFMDTSVDLGLDSSSGPGKNIVTTYSIFAKDVGPGTITLFQSTLAPSGNSMYGIAAVPAPVPEPTTLALLGSGSVFLFGYNWSQTRRRSRGIE